MRNESRLRIPAKLISRNNFLTQKFFDLFFQLVLYSPSTYFNNFSRSLAGKINLDANISSIDPENLRANLQLFEYTFVDEKHLTRIGPSFDGGYVLYNEIDNLTLLISIGVARDTAFEEDLLTRNSKTKILLFDHTDQPLRKLSHQFTFISKGLGDKSNENLLSLDDIIKDYVTPLDRSILKVDIEGNEYKSFESISSNSLSCFDQILIELHDLGTKKVMSQEFKRMMNALRENFHLIHLHGNNNDPWVSVGGAVIPQTLELTWLHKKFSNYTSIGNVSFPRVMDCPNTHGQEMILGSFKF